MPLISVILCVYNPQKEQLLQAVESIIHQTFTDWEMILYDDGSEERFDRVIREAAEKDRRIRHIRNRIHHSLAYGLNESIKMAVGTYIARMDGDDISDPRRLQKEYEFLEENPNYDFVGCNLVLIGEEGEKWGTRTYPEIPQKKDFLRYSPYAHPSVLFRKLPLLEHGAYKKGEKACRGEDYELFMRLYSEGVYGYNLQEALLLYRESEVSYKRRTLKYQLQEVGIRFRGFQKLKIREPEKWLYLIKPLLVWFIPNRWLIAWKRRRGRERFYG